jgi:hypothetical protein
LFAKPPISLCATKKRAGQGMSARKLCIANQLSWQMTPPKSLVMFVNEVRVPQPPDQSSNAGNREAAAHRAAFFLVTFSWRRKKSN